MKNKLFSILLLLALIFGTLAPVTHAQAKAADSASSKGASPEGMLNADGTLKLDQGFRGALDLSGYSVDIDSARGPVFGPARSVQSAVTPGNWAALGDGGGVVDGFVRAILVDGANVYIGGDFTDLANLPAADYVAKWDGANWSALGSDSLGDGSLRGTVNALAMIGTDLYAGGSFGQVYNGGTYLGGAANVAKWDTLTGNWFALGSNGAGGGSLNSSVTEMAVSGSNVYVAGYFTNVNNGGTVIPEADYVAKWDTLTGNWSALGNNGAGDGSLGSGTYIGALAVNGTDVYVGGDFTNINNGGAVLTAADKVAKWDGSNWSALGSNGAGNGSITSGTVYSLAVSGANVYVGGQFTDVNNNGSVLTAADWLAKWDGANWSALGSNGAGDGALNNIPFALFINGAEVYVGGSFTNVNNSGTAIPEADYLAKWDGSNWSAIGSNGVGDGAITNKGGPVIFAFAIQGSNLFTGGLFYDLNNGGTVLPQADYLAQWDGANWSALGADSNGALVSGYTGNQVNAIAVIGTDVYVGGHFTNISNHGVNIPEGDYIAKWDGANWSALGSNGAGNGSFFLDVYALAVIGTDLYVGGRFTNVNNNGTSLPTADYVAKWDTLTNAWSALGSNGAGNGSLPASSYVYALTVSGTDLYVGGQFTNVNNGGAVIPEADYLAKWDTLTGNWSALGSNGAGDGALNGQVSALAIGSLSELYVGGVFTNAAAIPEADYLAKWNAGSWSALGSNGAGDGALNAGVSAIAVNGLNVYAGGSFINVNNGGTVLNAADYIAKWDGSNWSALGNGANGSIESTVRAIAVSGSDVYVGGQFTNVNNGGLMLLAADRVAKWDGVNWSALGSNGAGDGSINGNNGIVYALKINGTDLLVGGQFSNVNNNGTVLKEADYLAAYGINVTPTNVSLSASSVTENLPAGTTVGSFTTTDPNPADTHTYSFCGGADDTSFSITGSTLKTVAVFDYETKSSYSICVRTTDSGSLTFDKTFAVTVTDANENSAPTDITLSASTVTENLPAASTVGSFTSTDPDAGDTFTYSLVSGTGSDGNAAFTISGNELKTAFPFNYLTKNSYSIRVHTTDSGSLTFEKTFAVTVTDATPIFADVLDSYWAVSWIERLYNAGITGGCSTSPLNYCPDNSVTRAQMAVFLLKGIHGSTYTPPTVGAGTGFTDVPNDYWAAAWIKQLAAEGITSGCGIGFYCPDSEVTRAQMAIFLLKSEHGTSYAPPNVGAGTGFTDVPNDYWAAAWIKQLAAEGITGGCGTNLYCPDTPVTRAQMAVFLVKTFGLP